MSINRTNILLEGELYRFHNDVPKKRYLILTHGAIYEYLDQRLTKLRHTYELTSQTTVHKVPKSASFELSIKGGTVTESLRFAVDSNALGDSAAHMCEMWVTEIAMLVEKMASEERALESSKYVSIACASFIV